MIKHVAFCQQIVILGTAKREDQFLAADGWVIREERGGVTLSRPEMQNLPEVAAFRVHGIGYCVSVDKQTEMLGEMVTAGIIDERSLGDHQMFAEDLLGKAGSEALRPPLDTREAEKIAGRVFGKGRNRGR